MTTTTHSMPCLQPRSLYTRSIVISLQKQHSALEVSREDGHSELSSLVACDMLSRQLRAVNNLTKLSGLGLCDGQKETTGVRFSNLSSSFFETFTKSRHSILDSVKSSFLGLVSASNDSAENGSMGPPLTAMAKGDEGTREDSLQSKESVADRSLDGVFVILDRFPTDNHVVSLQLLAEIGALFPDAVTLHQFHQSGNTLRLSNVHGQLRSVQLRLVQQLSPAAALDVYKAFAVLRFTPADEVHEALFTNVAYHAGSLGVPDIANFLQAHLMVQSVLDSDTLTAFSKMLVAALKASKKRNVKEAPYVVHVLDLFVKHQLRDEDFLTHAVEYLRARVKGLSAHGLVSTVTSLMYLEHPAGKLFDAIVLEVLHRGPDMFLTSELSQLAAALTETKHCDVMTDVLMDSIAVTCQKRMKTLRFEELVDLLWAYAHHMHFHHDAKLLECLAAGLVTRLQTAKQISGSTCVKLCDIVTASDLGPETSCCFLEAASSHIVSVMDTLNQQELLRVATACRKARFVCPRLLEAVRDRFESHSSELTLSELCQILNNFTSLNFNPGDELLELALRQTENTDDLSPTEVSRLIWSLAYFNKLTVENSRPLFDHLQNFSRSNFNALDTQKLLLSEKLVLLSDSSDSQDSENDDDRLIPEPLHSELTAMWRERIYFTRSVSPFQQEVSRMLTKLNVDHETEALIDNGDLSVDFLLYLGSSRSEGDVENNLQKNTVLECDGPRRSSVNAPHVPLGQTMTFKKIMKAQGWDVFVISKEDWYKKSATEQENLLRKTLKLC